MRIFGNTPGIQDTIDEHINDFDTIQIDTNKGRAFVTNKDNWLKNRFPLDLGYGKQYFMAKDKWKIE